MKIMLGPQVGLDRERIFYTFDENTITAELNGVKETFDFSGLPEGELVLEDEDGNELLETKTGVRFIISAVKEDDTLYVELLNYIGGDASYEERFPEWIDTGDYIQPVVPDEPVDNDTPIVGGFEPDEYEGVVEE